MGLYDSVVAVVRCPQCHLAIERTVQFKHEACLLNTYRVGDFVPGAPAGRPLLRSSFACHGPGTEPAPDAEGGHDVDCWVHFDRGFLTGVTVDAPAVPAEVAWWMLERAGAEAARLRWAMASVQALVRNRRRALAGEEEPHEHRFPTIWRVEDEVALLERLERIVAQAEEDAWPGGKE